MPGLFDTTTRQQLFKLLPDDGAAWDYFGIAVAISGSTAIVGAIQHNHNGGSFGPGAAYLFDASVCPADLDDDGTIGVTDLIAVILGWGTDDADVTGDGTTDVADLNAVLTAWWPCG